MVLRKKAVTVVDPHDAADELASGALGLFQNAQAALEQANAILDDAIANDEAYAQQLLERAARAKANRTGNAKVAAKIADLLS